MAEDANSYYRKDQRMSSARVNNVAMILVLAGVALWATSKLLTRV